MVKSKKFTGVYIYESGVRAGDECYYIKYVGRNGKVKLEKVGWKSEGYTLPQADKIRAARIHQLRHDVELPDKKVRSWKLDEVFELWKEHKVSEGLKFTRMFNGYFKWISPVFGSKYLDEITPEGITKLLGSFRSQMSDSYRYTLRHILKSNFDYAISNTEIGFKGENPVSKTKPIKVKNDRQRILTEDEVNLLLEKARTMGMDMYLFCLIGVSTGMRSAEIQNIHGRDLNLNGRLITFVGKGGKPRYVEICWKLHELLSQMPLKPNEKLFSKPIWDRDWKALMKLTGLNDGVEQGNRTWSCSPHTMRHTFGSTLAAQGTPINLVQDLMGHADIKTTMRYLKHAPRAGSAEINRMMDRFKVE
jgi:integrase